MARVRAFVVFLLAVTAGGALAYGTYNYVQRQPTTAASMPTRPVVIAAADLGIGTELRREDLKALDCPATAVPAGAFSSPNEIVGRGLVLPVIQNEPIVPLKLASKERGGGLTPVISHVL